MLQYIATYLYTGRGNKEESIKNERNDKQKQKEKTEKLKQRKMNKIKKGRQQFFFVWIFVFLVDIEKKMLNEREQRCGSKLFLIGAEKIRFFSQCSTKELSA